MKNRFYFYYALALVFLSFAAQAQTVAKHLIKPGVAVDLSVNYSGKANPPLEMQYSNVKTLINRGEYAAGLSTFNGEIYCMTSSDYTLHKLKNSTKSDKYFTGNDWTPVVMPKMNIVPKNQMGSLRPPFVVYPSGGLLTSVSHLPFLNKYDSEGKKLFEPQPIPNYDIFARYSRNGDIKDAWFDYSSKMEIDNNGNVYVLENAENDKKRIRRVSADGTVTTDLDFSDYPYFIPVEMRDFQPAGMTLDPATGVIYVFDASKCRVYKIDPSSSRNTLPNISKFLEPFHLNVVPYDYSAGLNQTGVSRINQIRWYDGALYLVEEKYSSCGWVCDSKIATTFRKVTPNGIVSTLFTLKNDFSWPEDFAKELNFSCKDGDFNTARVSSITDFVIDSDGNVILQDAMSGKILIVENDATTISPALPEGLALSKRSQTITGALTKPAELQDYNLTFRSATSGVYRVSVQLGTPVELSYTPEMIMERARQGSFKATTNFSTSSSSYSITPALPPGLSLNPSSGEISGTPTQLTPKTTYVVTASRVNGNQASFTFNLSVVDFPKIQLKSGFDNVVVKGGLAVTLDVFSVIKGTDLKYSISPSLEGTGLVFNSSTGQISGTPSASILDKKYTILADNKLGQTSIEFKLTAVFEPELYYPTVNFARTNVATKITPRVINGSSPTFEISPALPSGLTLNKTTGEITGTAISPLVATAYTVTLKNQNGVSVNANLSLAIGDVPNISSDRTAHRFILNEYFSSLDIKNSGGKIPSVLHANVSVFAGSKQGGAEGTALAASFNAPSAIAIDAQGNQYIADGANHRIRKIDKTGLVTTFAGSGSAAFVNGTGVAASFNRPNGLAIDVQGNIYVADTDNHRIRKIDKTGLVTTFAGSGSAGFVNGTGVAASFNRPMGITIDSFGNIYVADSMNHRIRKIDDKGVVSTFAGSGVSGYVNAMGTAATFNSPEGLAVDSKGDMYVADTGNGMIRKITKEGAVTAYPNVNPKPGLNPMDPSTEIGFNPRGIVVDNNGNVYVSDTNKNLIRRITKEGLVTTLAGSGKQASDNGLGKQASFNRPRGLALDAQGNLYVADENNHLIRKITTLGYAVSPALPEGLNLNLYAIDARIIGKPTQLSAATDYTITAYNEFGQSNDVSIQFEVGLPLPTISYTVSGVKAAKGVDLIVIKPTVTKATKASYTINPTLPAGLIFNTSTGEISGKPTVLSAPANYTVTITDTAFGGGSANTSINLAVGDVPNISVNLATNKFPINKAIPALEVKNSGGSIFPSQNMVSTFSGKLRPDFYSIKSSLNSPHDVALDKEGNLYVVDQRNSVIRKITKSGESTTLAGSGYQFVAGMGMQPTLDNISSLTVDGQGNVYVTNSKNIHKITKEGVLSTLAGTGKSGNTDGIGTSASFSLPRGLAVDAQENVYVVDQMNNNVRKITKEGVVTTVAGSGRGGNTDGMGTAASFNNPMGIAVDSQGNLYVADGVNRTIRKITKEGLVTTFAGSGREGNTDGIGRAATFNSPSDVIVDEDMNVYVVDAGNYNVRKITKEGVVTTLAGTGPADPANFVLTPMSEGTHPGCFANGPGWRALFRHPKGIAVDPEGNLYVADQGNHMIRKISTFSYSVTPALPAGLKLNTLTGIISGTPTELSATKTYTITAYNEFGQSNDVAIQFEVILEQPTISYAFTEVNITKDVDLAALKPRVSNAEKAIYSISPALPAGLVFNSSTGEITGKPSESVAMTSYQVTLSNDLGSATF
ncbi:MAG: putative Ig domain-containing protein, partial [Sphingobacteriaceae bacterium]|nr:putative Ig domain-containing protein [Sphingobacteriaceae bacterium]